MIPIRAALVFLAFVLPAHADPVGLAREIGADVLFLRHATAPGTGDPPGFRLNECSTQRNLSDAGREQARAIGRAIRAADFPVVQVLSSQWCRARDTAELLNLGPVIVEPGLNSFFGDQAAREPTLAGLAQAISTLPEGITVMVTHQVVITAVTGQTVASGGAVLFDRETGRAEVVQFP